ncbi:helix-turn-helix protein [Hypnocyclicus thermotrophus]|uniref:Helix-turn-helix protein n=1 Tax=Hypnocyclicus thermotrophus TaxID=1627895 RepID=A0AA46DZD9_9FUSO|nr:helix-turn-helix transcriptional regulator [Hypnocyclicus thermotrophus]TDT71554.1 helix-turn-helix protein [Hypnocyclicus thermotrophus]
MAGNRSFRDYVADRFENEMYAAIQSYATDNYNNLDLQLYRVRKIGGIELSDIEVKFVSVSDLPDMEIEFDVVVGVELEVREADYHYDESEYCSQWFTLKCSGNLECNLNDFAILSVAEYTNKNKQPKPMSDALVPIIYKNQLEEIATQFLKDYYPKALLQPMPVDPMELAKGMGLNIEVRNITKDCSVFGQIFFHNSTSEFYDKDSDELVSVDVNEKTIFVDPETYFLYNLGKVNNTIIHECVHWDKHRKAFELERLYNSEASRIKCQAIGGVAGNSRDATEWMEWQANALAPRIQMPMGMFKTQAWKFIKQFRESTGKFDIIDVIEPVIDALSTFFCVSRTAAKIRMVDAGFEEAIGTFTYIDGRYVATHRFKKGILKEHQTFSISAEEAAIQSITNQKLSRLVGDGSYQYVDAHFVFNHPKYLTQDDNEFTILTDYARNHMEECCLVFDMTVKSGTKKDYHSVCFLNKDKDSTVSFNIVYGDGYAYADHDKQIKLVEDVVMDEMRVYKSLPNDFCESLKVVLKWRGITYKELEKKIMVDDQTISRIANGKRDPSINTLVLICLGLHLPPNISKHIIDKSPCTLNFCKQEHIWYDFALTHLSKQSMESIFDFLHDHNIAV